MPEYIQLIPVHFDPGMVSERLHFNRARSDDHDLADLISMAQRLIQARSVYETAYMGARGEGTVEVATVTFESPILSKNLNGANKVFPYIITVGPELEHEATAQSDLLRQYYLEEIANIALEQAGNWLAKHLEERYAVTNLSSMSPGSLEDWPIREQAKLFSIFGDTEKLIGVRLTDSMLMVPRKSISGILFPSEEGFVACQLCEREHCPGRKAAYTGRL